MDGGCMDECTNVRLYIRTTYVAASPPPSVKTNPKSQNPWNPARTQPVHITSSQARAIPSRLCPACADLARPDYVQPAKSQPVRQPRASPSKLHPASWESACAACIQLAKNHLRVSMSALSRASPAGQKSARPNHIQLTKVSQLWWNDGARWQRAHHHTPPHLSRHSKRH